MSYFTTAAVMIAIAALIFTLVPGIGGAEPDNAEELREQTRDKKAKLVDVRTPREFSSNGLDGAINVPLQEIAQRFSEVGSPNEPVILYCRSGNRSAQAKRFLEQQGYTEVYDLGSHRSASRFINSQ